MNRRSMTAAIAAAALTTATFIGIAGPAYAAPGVSVTPATNANPGGQTFQISGSGFSATANGGLGVYVAFGPNPALHPSDWFNNISYYETAVWVHPGGTGTATNKNMNANGTFTFTLTNGDGSPLTAAYGTTNCQQIQCGIVTMAAHGSTDRSQDSFRPISFGSPVNPNPATAKVGVAQSTPVPAFAGTAPYSWSVAGGVLPPGLALNSANGVISGTPTAEGRFKTKVQVIDSAAKPKKVKTTVDFRVAPIAINIAPSSLANAQTNVLYSRQLTASGGVANYKFKVTAGSLPAKVRLSGKGLLKGKPAAAGSFTFTVTVTDKYKYTSTRSYMLTVT